MQIIIYLIYLYSSTSLFKKLEGIQFKVNKKVVFKIINYNTWHLTIIERSIAQNI